MKFPQPVSIGWVAELINATIVGDGNAVAIGINEIHRVEKGDLCFVDHPKYYDACLKSDASIIIINQAIDERYEKPLLVCSHPFEAYLKIVSYFKPFIKQQTLIDPTAIIDRSSYIAPGVSVGPHVVIGKDCIIHPGAHIYAYAEIGNRVVIHSGAVIGADAFYFNGKRDREVWYQKMTTAGRVIIEDDVEIGANTCIDSGVTHQTIIGRGTKIDNLVQIGHDVVVGNNCIIASQVGIAGATTIGNGVTIWGQVGINKTIAIGDQAVILGQSGVTASLPGGKVYMGYPAEEASIKRREFVWLKRIPEIWEQVKKLS